MIQQLRLKTNPRQISDLFRRGFMRGWASLKPYMLATVAYFVNPNQINQSASFNFVNEKNRKIGPTQGKYKVPKSQINFLVGSIFLVVRIRVQDIKTKRIVTKSYGIRIVNPLIVVESTS
jgi:hypothetical protein